jgi:2-polyprenyl-3-methyl-5-hydroxy-6-metoxy-1,4-benzoquinol methylase
MSYPALERWGGLPRNAPRDEYFRVLREAVTEFYLADASNPYQQSGRSSGVERWEETRRCLVKAIHRNGDFLDVGCANGLLLETLMVWAREEGFSTRPHGIDLVPELVELARQRFRQNRDCFEVANAFYWSPKRQYDFVRTNLEYVPEQDWSAFIRAQYAAVSPGGRLIVCHYRNAGEPYVEVGMIARQAGYPVAGRTEALGVAIAWIQRPD